EEGEEVAHEARAELDQGSERRQERRADVAEEVEPGLDRVARVALGDLLEDALEALPGCEDEAHERAAGLIGAVLEYPARLYKPAAVGLLLTLPAPPELQGQLPGAS